MVWRDRRRGHHLSYCWAPPYDIFSGKINTLPLGCQGPPCVYIPYMCSGTIRLFSGKGNSKPLPQSASQGLSHSLQNGTGIPNYMSAATCQSHPCTRDTHERPISDCGLRITWRHTCTVLTLAYGLVCVHIIFVQLYTILTHTPHTAHAHSCIHAHYTFSLTSSVTPTQTKAPSFLKEADS